MKLTAKIFVLLLLSTALLTFNGCNKKPTPAPSDEEVQLGKLSKTWKATSVKKSTVDQTGYTNFTLKIEGVVGASSFQYSTTGRPSLSPWLASGSWNFGTDPTTQIIRDKGTADELSFSSYSVTETTLELRFNFAKPGYSGRVDNVTGEWVMTFGL